MDKSVESMLRQRHIVRGIRLYYEAKTSSYMDREFRRWLEARSISKAQLTKHFIIVSATAKHIGIKPASVLQAVRKGRFGVPLYNYSRYSDPFHYEIWLTKSAVMAYTANRRQKR